MKNTIILHGTGDRNDMYWFPYVKKFLEENDYEVWLPQLPNAEKPNLKEWLPFVLENGKFSENTFLIGHSAGAQLILSVLENISVVVKQCVLVSGYASPLKNEADMEAGERDFNWSKIKGKAKQIIFINSDNDPWGCDDKQGRKMLDNLGGLLVIPKGEGHMGSTTYKQPYTQFPLLTKLLDI